MRKLVAVAVCLFAAQVALAKGPVGVGELKIGSTKSAIEALPETSSVHLVKELIPYEYKNEVPVDGEEKFTTQVVTPWSATPLDATLTFAADRLVYVLIILEDTAEAAEKVAGQIRTKYGAAKVDDQMKEEQCVYKNGANFKIKSGVMIHVWSEAPPKGKAIETKLVAGHIAICPGNLSYASVGPVVFNSLGVGYPRPKPPAAPNPF